MPLPEVLLVAAPSVDLGRFLPACREALGYSPARAADASHRRLSEAETFLSCLAALRDKEAAVGNAPSPSLLPHISFSIFLVVDERDMRDTLSHCSGMPFISADTAATGVAAAVISGTLARWRDAVVSGSGQDVKPSVRAGFNRIYHLFRGMNWNIWSDYSTRELPDGTLVLERKRRP